MSEARILATCDQGEGEGEGERKSTSEARILATSADDASTLPASSSFVTCVEAQV